MKGKPAERSTKRSLLTEASCSAEHPCNTSAPFDRSRKPTGLRKFCLNTGPNVISGGTGRSGGSFLNKQFALRISATAGLTHWVSRNDWQPPGVEQSKHCWLSDVLASNTGALTDSFQFSLFGKGTQWSCHWALQCCFDELFALALLCTCTRMTMCHFCGKIRVDNHPVLIP